MESTPDTRLPDVLCNMCGFTCMLGPLGDGSFANEPGGLVNHVVNGGYNSTPGNGDGAFDDMTSYRFSLCEFCLDWLFAQFRLPVVATDYHDGVESWKPASERVIEDVWRGDKKGFFDNWMKRAAARRIEPG